MNKANKQKPIDPPPGKRSLIVHTKKSHGGFPSQSLAIPLVHLSTYPVFISDRIV